MEKTPIMFAAIRTKFCGPTDYRGSRISASCQAGRMMVDWDYALNPSENHRSAALMLAQKVGWVGDGTSRTRGQLVGGWYDNIGYFVINQPG